MGTWSQESILPLRWSSDKHDWYLLHGNEVKAFIW